MMRGACGYGDVAESQIASAQVMMIQQGARRNYVYARQLEQAGLLHSLVTDAAWAEGDGGLARRFFALSGPISRRTVRGVAAARIHSSYVSNIAELIVSGLRAVGLHEERGYQLVDEIQALRCRVRGLGGAKIIINYHGNGGSFLDYAKARGAKIVTDFVNTPKYLEIEAAERDHWPDWEPQSSSPKIIEFYRQRMARLLQISDLYLCPSQTVARDLADLPGFDPSRLRLVPYGLSGVLLRPAAPIQGRVLFAGAAGLRKGLPYLAEAARILKKLQPEIEIVIAGHVAPAIRSRPEVQNLTFLGQLNRESMAEEFSRADIFCLPSLAEGSATSIFEAMANGLPTVTTSSSGSMVVDGVDGRIVPERDGVAIASAITQIVSDRNLRQRMSGAALATASLYDDKACGQRFVDVIRTLISSTGVQ